MTIHGSVTDIGADFTARLVQAEQVERELTTSTGLREAAGRLREATERAGCLNVIAASQRAESVLAAAAILDDHLNVVDQQAVMDGVVDKVLVVEAVAVTGMFAQQRVHAMREAGASWVGVVVLHDLSDASLGSLRFGPVDDLIAI